MDDSEEERRAAFLASLSEEAVAQVLGARFSDYGRLLGLRAEKGQPLNLEKLVKTGLPLSAGKRLSEHLGMDPKEFLTLYIGMSESTFRRRSKSLKSLSTVESDRVVRYARLLSLTVNLMSGSDKDARDWLSSASYALGGTTPLEAAVTETGARRVENLLIALGHGMFS